jgi:hypothetical protein
MRNTTGRGSMLRRMITTTLAAAALGTSLVATAQTDKEAALESRIAELEKQVQALLAAQKAAPPTPAVAPAASPSTVTAAAPAKPAPAPI